MAKSIRLTVKEWTKIRKRLKEEYAWKPSLMLVRSVMQRELGFLPRLHTEWSEQMGSTEVVFLDFYDDNMETLFRLKYL